MQELNNLILFKKRDAILLGLRVPYELRLEIENYANKHRMTMTTALIKLIDDGLRASQGQEIGVRPGKRVYFNGR